MDSSTLREAEAAVAMGQLDELPASLHAALEPNVRTLRLRPELLLPCAAHALGHGADGTGLIESWSEQWRCLGRRRWLRSLRAPARRRPFVAEYRGPVAGRPWFSSDDTVVGVASLDQHSLDAHIAWQRASGTRSDAAPPERRVRYSLDAMESSFGRLVLQDSLTGTSKTLTPGVEDQLQEICELDDGDVLAAGWFGDYEGVVVRFDMTTGKIVWRIELEHRVTTLAVAGSRAVLSLRGHSILECATGEVVAHLPNDKGMAALSVDHRALAVFDGATLRVWDLEDPQTRQALGSPGEAGFTAAQFSAEGSLLLSGSRLFDGRTGVHLATLPLESPGYLEGGPARGCTRVLEDGLIEAQVFHGVMRWDRESELLWSDSSRHHGMHGESLAFHPKGERYVMHARDGSTSVRDTRTGHRLHGLEAPGRWYELAYSLDGARLAVHGQTDTVWDVVTGECLGEQPSTGSSDWVGDLHGWHGFDAKRHALSGRLKDGLFEVHDDEGVLACIPSSEALVASPDGLYWAGRHSHYVLES